MSARNAAICRKHQPPLKSTQFGVQDTLHDGTDSERAEEPSGGEADDACDGEPAQLFQGGARAAEDAAREQAEDHCAECRDKAEGHVSASICDEGFFARKEIQEPGVERRRGVRVFVPVRGESGERLRCGIERPERKGEPVSGEDRAEGDRKSVV